MDHVKRIVCLSDFQLPISLPTCFNCTLCMSADSMNLKLSTPLKGSGFINPENFSTMTIDEEDYRHLAKEFVRGKSAFDATDETIIWIIWTFLAITGFCSNFAIVLLILARRSFQNTNILLVFNLCMADLLYILSSVPFNLISILRRHYPFGEAFCKLTPFVQANAFIVTASTVMAIAIDRQHRIINCSNFSRNITRPNCRLRFLLILIIWTTSILFSSPVLLFQQFQSMTLSKELTFHLCIENWPTSEARIAYYFITYSFFSLVPALTLGLSYHSVKKFLRVKFMDKRNRRDFLSRNGMTLKEIGNLFKVFDLIERKINRNTRVTIVLLMGFVAFIISWLPLSLYNLFIDFYHTRIPLSASSISRLLVICHTIAIISVTTNSIIYGFMNTNIQRQMGSFCQGKWIGV